jgi:DNA-binding transcriptional ArsR family regulator
MSKTRNRTRQGGKSIEEVVTYAVGHEIRVRILTVLAEGVFTAEEIAQIIDVPLNKVYHHLKELLDGGSIEIAKTEWRRNTAQHWYRGIKMPHYSDEEMAAMTPEQRQVTYGLVIQQVLAETMAAFWAGKMTNDPRVWLTNRWFNVDQQGRDDIADEQARSWERLLEIEAESVNRCANSGGEANSVIAIQLGFERERTGPSVPPANAD